MTNQIATTARHTRTHPQAARPLQHAHAVQDLWNKTGLELVQCVLRVNTTLIRCVQHAQPTQILHQVVLHLQLAAAMLATL